MGLGCPILPKGTQINGDIQKGVVGRSRAAKVGWHQRYLLGSGIGMCERTPMGPGQFWMSE